MVKHGNRIRKKHFGSRCCVHYDIWSNGDAKVVRMFKDSASSVSQFKPKHACMAPEEASHKSKAKGLVQNIGGKRALIYGKTCGKAPGFLYVIILEGEFRSELLVSATYINTN